MEERIAIAKKIPIKGINHLGTYHPMRCSPVTVQFECLGDVDYLIENKRNLKKGIYVEQEYGPEIEANRRKLCPIFNAARRHPDYKGKCKIGQ